MQDKKIKPKKPKNSQVGSKGLPYGLKSVPSKPGKKGKYALPVDTSPSVAFKGRPKPY